MGVCYDIPVFAAGHVGYYNCGGVWYEPQQQGSTVVYVVDNIEPGAETMAEFEE